MNELDDGRHADEIRGNGGRTAPAAQKDERGTDAFARGIDTIIRHAADLRLERSELAPQETIELSHVRLELRKNAGERGKRRGGERLSDGRNAAQGWLDPRS